MTELSHTDDASTQMMKLVEETNKLNSLNEELKVIGNYLNKAVIEVQELKGKFAEKKADIRCTKDRIATFKYLLKAEGSSL